MSEAGDERSIGRKNAERQERRMGRGSLRDIEKKVVWTIFSINRAPTNT